MSVAVDKLVGGGYIRRDRSPEDRRKVLLTLTREGRRVSDAHSVLDMDRVRGMMRQLTVEEREKGLAGLQILAEAADRYLAEHGSGWSYQSEGD